jgi:hypothetical protein
MADRTDQSGARASIPVSGEGLKLIQQGLTAVLPDSIELWPSSARARLPYEPHKGETVSVYSEH